MVCWVFGFGCKLRFIKMCVLGRYGIYFVGLLWLRLLRDGVGVFGDFRNGRMIRVVMIIRIVEMMKGVLGR